MPGARSDRRASSGGGEPRGMGEGPGWRVGAADRERGPRDPAGSGRHVTGIEPNWLVYFRAHARIRPR
jgi:hypothetical protein